MDKLKLLDSILTNISKHAWHNLNDFSEDNHHLSSVTLNDKKMRLFFQMTIVSGPGGYSHKCLEIVFTLRVLYQENES